jgi:uncharacterized protein (DUF952 family)
MLTRALYVAALLNISEHLIENKATLEELHQKTGSHKSSLSHLLNFLTLHDVFMKDEHGYYSNTDFSSTLCATHPASIKPFLLHDDETRWNCFGNLAYSIQTGQAAFDMLYDQSYFDYLKNHPELSVRFDAAMTTISSQEDDHISKALPFYGIVADIGGGKGQLIKKIKENNTEIKAILFDLPMVIENTTQDDAISHISASFFEPITFNADIFILKRILHDWDDTKALSILKNVALGMKDNSRLYILEGILDQSKNKKLLSAIDLALLTIFQGRERTSAEFTELLSQAGLEIVNITQIDDIICAIECQKVTVKNIRKHMSEITPAHLYKIVDPQAWQESQNKEHLLLAEVDKEFIHFSTEEQLERILQKYWADRAYILLKVDTTQLPGQMKFETNPGGVAKYYHLYNGAIPLKATTIVK